MKLATFGESAVWLAIGAVLVVTAGDRLQTSGSTDTRGLGVSSAGPGHRSVAHETIPSTSGTLARVTSLIGNRVHDLGDVNASQAPGTQSEISIAVDRFHEDNLVAAAMNLPDGRILMMSSTDRAESFSRATLPLAPGATIHADPMVAFDSSGVAYVAHIPVGPGNTPLGIDVNRSLDGGRSWLPAVNVSDATGRDDKVILIADDNPESPFRDRVYVGWKWGSGSVFVARSVDQGQSFTRPRLVDIGRVSGLDMAVASDGTLYLAFHDNPRDAIRVLRSSDGGESFDDPVDVATVRADWYTSPPSVCNRMALVHASIAVDRSSSPNRGDVYATWSDHPEGTDPAQCANPCDPDSACLVDVYLSRSTDAGRSWSPPIAVSEHLASTDRYHQWLDSDPESGAVYVAYLDTRNDSHRMGTDVYVSRSTDCALSWEPSVRASSGTSYARANDFQYGDYQGLTVVAGRVYPAWADYRAGEFGDVQASEVYVGRLSFEPSESGWSMDVSALRLEMTYRGTVDASTLAETYVWVANGSTGARTYFTENGSTTNVPESYETTSIGGSFRYSMSLPRTWLDSLDADATLAVVLIPFGQGPDGTSRVSSEVRLPISTLRTRAIVGCRD